MKVLLIDEKRRAPESLRLLAELGHSTELVEDAAAASARLEGSSPPDLVIVRWPFPGKVDWLRRSRERSGSPYVYLIALLEHTASAGDISSLYEAGLDDFVRRPLVRAEVAGRLGAPDRMKKAYGAGAGAAGGSKSAVARLPAYLRAGPIGGEALSSMLGPVDCAEAPVAESAVPGVRAAHVVLSLPSEETELCLSLLLEPASTASFALDLCGEADADGAVVDDMLRELANMTSGAVKAAALAANVVFTTGLPISERASRAGMIEERFWWLLRAGTTARIGVLATVRGRANEQVMAGKLLEGMVVARDLRNRSGALIVAAGTRLTSTAAERLPRILGETFMVDVAVVA